MKPDPGLHGNPLLWEHIETGNVFMLVQATYNPAYKKHEKDKQRGILAWGEEYTSFNGPYTLYTFITLTRLPGNRFCDPMDLDDLLARNEFKPYHGSPIVLTPEDKE